MTTPVRNTIRFTTDSAAAPARPLRRQQVVHPVLRGRRSYLRALRAAEMIAWERNLPRELAGPFTEAMARSQQE
jgi:hypothetical protein